VIGRSFSYDPLRAVSGMEDAPLRAALEMLAEADILLVQGLRPESDYRFKHALIQDAAYENLLKSRRQVLHRRVGEALRDNLAAIAPVEPELLAYHFTQAGLTEAAFEWWAKAGQRSLERSALVEAVDQFMRALGQIAALPATPALRREQIRLQVALITALGHVRGFTAPETSQRLVAGIAPPFDRRVGQARLSEVMRKRFRLGRRNGGEAIAQTLGDAAVQNLAPALEQIFVSRVLNERVLETIFALGRQPLDQHNVSVGDFSSAACKAASSIPATSRSSE